jgi:tetratricopeptide (TPR) repeat protein
VRRHRGSVSLVLLVLVALGAFIWRLGVERNRALEAEALAAQRAVAAEQSARVARNALDFFSGLLGEVVPDRAQGRSVDIDVLLAKGRARLQRELPEDSADAAMLGGYLGTLHGTLGEPRRAIELLEPALSALSAGGLDDGTTWAGLADSMAAEQAKVGDLAAAAQWSQRAADAWRGLAERAGAGAARARLRTRFAEAYAHYIQGELEPAATLLAEALAADADPADAAALRDERASAATLLVGALAKLGRYDDAVAAADAALAELDQQGAVETRGGLALLRDRGATLVTAGRAADGLAELERAMEVHSAIFGARGEGYASLLNERGIAYNELGRYAEARKDFEHSLALDGADADAALDPVVVGNLASVCSSIGDWDCALGGYRRMLDGLAAGPTMLPQQVRLNRQAYARALSESGDTQTARPLLEQALAAAIGEDGEGSPNAAASLLHLARNELRAGRSAAALAFTARARAAFAALVAPEHFVFAALDRIEGFAALGEGRIDDAQRLIQSYHDATVASDGADSFWAALAGLDLAALRHAQRRDDEARALLRQHLPKVRDTVLPTHPDRAAGEMLAVRLGVD